MCLGIPGRIVERTEDRGLAMARVAFGDVEREVCVAYVPDAGPGDWVLVHVGFAISQIDEAEAKRVFALLEEAFAEERA